MIRKRNTDISMILSVCLVYSKITAKMCVEWFSIGPNNKDKGIKNRVCLNLVKQTS